MNQRAKARAMAILALLAVGLYSLCCKPAWNPEGDEVAYVFSESFGEHTTWGVAVCDVQAKRSRVIIEQVADDKTALVPVEVFWPEKGDELVIVSAPLDESDRKDVVKVSTYNFDVSSVAQEREFTVPDASLSSSFAPMYLERGRWLWLYGGDNCYRIDLKEGSVTQPAKAGPVLHRGNKSYSIVQGAEDELVFQRIATFCRVRETPLFTVPCPEGHSLIPVLAMPKKHTWFACIDKSPRETTLHVFNLNGTVLDEITLPDEFEFDGDVLPGAEWSPDGSTLWLTVKGESGYVGIAEIPIQVAGLKQRLAFGAKKWGKVRPLLSTTRFIKFDQEQREDDLTPLQLSLSPTGDYLAASFMTGKPESIGLYLVELAGDSRRVTLVPPPQPGAQSQPSEAQ